MVRRRERVKRWLTTGKPIEAPEPLSEGEVDAAVADGELIARFSSVLSLKNRLIVSALRDDHAFDPEQATEAAREVLAELAAEQDANATHADEMILDAESDQGVARHEHDYKARDLELLGARRQVYREVARRIRADAADPVALAALVEDARARAWEEIGREIAERLDQYRSASSIVVDDEYRRDREERMRRLREFDLWELADARRSTRRRG